MARTQTVEKPNFDTVWAVLQEVSAMQKKSQKESEERLKEIDRLIKDNAYQIGKLGGRFGEMVEYMVVPNLLAKFQELGFVFEKVHQNSCLKDKNITYAEVDIMLENGDKIMLVEVKSKPTTEDIKEHIERIEKIRAHTDSNKDNRKYLGAVAGMVFGDMEKKFAMKNGFYIIEPSGDTFLITAPQGKYSPREW